jgi:class 3 adenylate cyclase
MGTAILVVDDLEDNRLALRMRLELAGYTNVSEAANGREALLRLREQTFDLVLLDIMMPEMTGYQVLEVMKADTELRNTAVIMISAMDQIDSVVRCIELGASDYLTKPFNPALLKARIDTFVEKAQYKAQELAYHRRVEAEKKRADKLLGSVLPKQVARVLMANNKLSPLHYDNVTVLFCDLVGFTAYSESKPPEIVFSQLEALIEEFEELITARGLMKIKTIGDAMMVTAGLLEDIDDPVRHTVDCGFAMVTAALRHEAKWQIRVGIDHGPVVAGIIGRTNFQFDIWGDTVNTAARIEAVSTPGSVNVSGRAWQQLNGRARGRSRGMIDLKGKAPVEVIECEQLKSD